MVTRSTADAALATVPTLTEPIAERARAMKAELVRLRSALEHSEEERAAALARLADLEGSVWPRWRRRLTRATTRLSTE